MGSKLAEFAALMQLTRAADYAVRVMIHLASQEPGKRTSVPEIARAVEVPENFLSKVLQTLSRRGLIQSHRGVTGGFELSAGGRTVSMLEVLEALEGPIALNVCVGECGACRRKSRCPAHKVWVEAQEALAGVLRRASIADLARQAA